MNRTSVDIMGVVFVGLVLSGCGTSLTTYVKPEASWETIQKTAVLPFTIPSENVIRRQSVTQLFTAELRRVGLNDVIEVPLKNPMGELPSPEAAGKEYQVDAVFSGSIDEAQGVVIHIRLIDVATSEILWSATDLLGVGSEFFSLKTQQQQIQKRFRRMARDFSKQYRR